MNISGVIVKTTPNNIYPVSKTLSLMDGVEIHGNNHDGRIVVTVEQESANSLSDTVQEIQDVPGVLSAAMIYHQFED